MESGLETNMSKNFTEKEIEIAYLRDMLRFICYDHLSFINRFRTGNLSNEIHKTLGLTPLEVYLQALDTYFKKKSEQPDKELWEIIYPFKEWKEHHLMYLSASHSKECPKPLSFCPRCSAEYAFQLPSTK